MPEYRTPDEEQAQAAHEQRVQAVIEQAVADGVSCSIAITLGEPADVVELWTDRFWDGLRDRLSDDHPVPPGSNLMADEDRLTAVALLLRERIQAEAAQILRVGGGEGGSE